MLQTGSSMLREANDNAADINGEHYEYVSIGTSSYKHTEDTVRVFSNFKRHRIGVGFVPPSGFGSSCRAGSFDVDFINITK